MRGRGGKGRQTEKRDIEQKLDKRQNLSNTDHGDMQQLKIAKSNTEKKMSPWLQIKRKNQNTFKGCKQLYFDSINNLVWS